MTDFYYQFADRDDPSVAHAEPEGNGSDYQDYRRFLPTIAHPHENRQEQRNGPNEEDPHFSTLTVHLISSFSRIF